jgi:hypothetical protein
MLLVISLTAWQLRHKISTTIRKIKSFADAGRGQWRIWSSLTAIVLCLAKTADSPERRTPLLETA